jgi:hypothetical protein
VETEVPLQKDDSHLKPQQHSSLSQVTVPHHPDKELNALLTSHEVIEAVHEDSIMFSTKRPSKRYYWSKVPNRGKCGIISGFPRVFPRSDTNYDIFCLGKKIEILEFSRCTGEILAKILQYSRCSGKYLPKYYSTTDSRSGKQQSQRLNQASTHL